jgi:hypothetical protein
VIPAKPRPPATTHATEREEVNGTEASSERGYDRTVSTHPCARRFSSSPRSSDSR